MESVLEKTISQMPASFTSNEFNNKAVQNGYPRKELRKKGLGNFLRRYARNAYKGSKTWIKNPTDEKISTINNSENIMSTEEMIIELKNKGYKVMRKTIGWEEC